MQPYSNLVTFTFAHQTNAVFSNQFKLWTDLRQMTCREIFERLCIFCANCNAVSHMNHAYCPNSRFSDTHKLNVRVWHRQIHPDTRYQFRPMPRQHRILIEHRYVYFVTAYVARLKLNSIRRIGNWGGLKKLTVSSKAPVSSIIHCNETQFIDQFYLFYVLCFRLVSIVELNYHITRLRSAAFYY
jgi:hypothetical protein